MATPGTKFEISNRIYGLVAAFFIVGAVFLGFRAYEIVKTANGAYPREITIEATGKAYVVPDTAQISIGVTVKGADSAIVMQDSTKKVNDIYEALKKLGVEKEDIKTTNYSLYPNYNWTEQNGSVQDGYVLDQSFEIKIKDFAKIGDIVAQTSAMGANMIGGVGFIADNTESAKNEARMEALKKLEEKTKMISEATGIEFGKTLNYYEYDNSYMPYPMMGGVAMERSMSDAASSVPVFEPGQQEINLNVSVTYRLK